MKQRSDQDLLEAWSRHRSQDSFRLLVNRYADLVFGTALRRTRDRGLAEEVSQNVFTALAKKAGRLDGQRGIGGWLFKTTVLEAAMRCRSEARRDQRMRELSELEAALRSAGGEAMTGDALALVDEGLAELAPRDRNVLVERFYKGASFADLAKKSGRSEVACRKQVSRALQRLAAALEGRGVRVSSAVLAAGLSALMSIEAPAGLASTCAATAIAAAGGGAGAGILTTVLSAMSISKTTGVAVIGGVLLFVSTGTGYLVGRQYSKSGARAADSETLAHKTPESRPGSKGEGRSGRRGAAGKIDTAEDDISRVEAIVRTLKREVRGKEYPEAMERGKEIVVELMASDMEEAVALIEGEEEQLRSVLLAVLFGYWGEIDGGIAVEHAVGLEDQDSRTRALNSAVSAWAAVNPQSAWHWQRGLAEQSEPPLTERSVRFLAGAVLREWARRDVDGAWDEFEKLKSDVQTSILYQLGDLILDTEHTEAMAKRMAAIAEEGVRARVAEEVGEQWARVDPEAAGSWFMSLEFSDPMLRMRSAMEIGEGWFETDPPAAATWLWPIIPEAMRGDFATMISRSPWAQEDPAGLAAWLKSREIDPENLKKD